MNEVAEIINQYGTSVILISYLIWRDYRFLTKLESAITAIQTLIKGVDNNAE